MTDRRNAIINELEKGKDNTIFFFKSLSPADLSVQVYQDGARWSVKQVLAHFITIERSMHRLFANILEGGPGSPADFDVERFNRTQPRKLDKLGLEALIERFRGTRNHTITMVQEMSERDLDRKGKHAFLGYNNLERFIRWAYEHNHLHEIDINKTLRNK
jgi:hypothetical protein